MEWLEYLDRWLFLFLNGFHNPWFDTFFRYCGLVVTWIPLYAVFLFFLVRRFKKKIGLSLTLVAFLVLFTDQSSVLIKNSVQRYRPSHNIELKENVHLINSERGGQFGFVSSHAANLWGIAIFVFLTLRPMKRINAYLLFIWASLVSYGRIYAGVHYPADVVGGMIVGITFGFLFYYFQCKMFQKFEMDIQGSSST